MIQPQEDCFNNHQRFIYRLLLLSKESYLILPYTFPKKMIYALKVFIQLLFVVAVASVVNFPLQKKSDREFVAGILARAAKGKK